jgi:hypothetical protein
VYRGFNLTVSDKKIFDRWYAFGQAAKITKNWEEFSDLRDYLEGQAINGTRVKADWFANAGSDIFLSHSHADEDLAIGIAGFLKQELGLSSFIDSLVWGHSNKLLKAIDDDHCWLDEKKEVYDYNKRNYSTSHVHMMLGTALTEMIDRCECVIFINTPQSIQATDSKKGTEETTGSPWIYHELATTKLIRRQSERRKKILMQKSRRVVTAEAMAMDSMRELHVNYEVPLAHLKSLSVTQLTTWANEAEKGMQALDWLYDTYAPNEEEKALLPYY